MGGGFSLTVLGPPLGGRGGGPAGFLKSEMLLNPTVFPPSGAVSHSRSMEDAKRMVAHKM